MSCGRVVVALSGSGRTLKNLISYQKENKSFDIVGVISSNPKAYGIEIAKEHGLEVYVEKFGTSSEASSELSSWLVKKKPDLIVLAGFLKVFPTSFQNSQEEFCSYLTVNIHPSLLPKFSGKGMYGMKVHKAVLEAGENQSGASTHLVTEVYDEGPLLAQKTVSVHPEDSPEVLASRVFEAECQLYPPVIESLLEEALGLRKQKLKNNITHEVRA